MKIENVSEGACSFCKKKATKKLDGTLYCSACADPEIIKQIGRCVHAVEYATISIKIIPKEHSNGN